MPAAKRLIACCLLSLALDAAANGGAALAQTGAEANAWAKWCKEQNGRVQITASTPVCIPPDTSGGGYSADQQAMLNLASQFGDALAGVIREGFRRSAERLQRLTMQRSWEEEVARRQAAEEFKQQRLRNENLIANMHGAINASDLGRSQVGTETLQLRTADQMFNRGGEARDALTQEVPISAPIDLAKMQAAQDAYFDALHELNLAEQAVIEKQTYVDDLQTFYAEAQHQRGEQSILLAAMAETDRARPAAQAALAKFDVDLADLAEARTDAIKELAELRGEAAQAREALRLAQGRRSALTGPSEPPRE